MVGSAVRGARVLIVAALCRWSYRHLDDCDLVVIEPDRVRIVKRRGTEALRHEFPRHWVRLVFDDGAGGKSPARLWIGSHGKFVSLADAVNENSRALVARELRRLLRSGA